MLTLAILTTAITVYGVGLIVNYCYYSSIIDNSRDVENKELTKLRYTMGWPLNPFDIEYELRPVRVSRKKKELRLVNTTHVYR